MPLHDPDPETAKRFGVVAVGGAATLLLTIAFLAKRIAHHSAEIEDSLYGILEGTGSLMDIPKTNFAIDGMTTELRRLREEVEA